jgi:hypothetical protein
MLTVLRQSNSLPPRHSTPRKSHLVPNKPSTSSPTHATPPRSRGPRPPPSPSAVRPRTKSLQNASPGTMMSSQTKSRLPVLSRDNSANDLNASSSMATASSLATIETAMSTILGTPLKRVEEGEGSDMGSPTGTGWWDKTKRNAQRVAITTSPRGSPKKGRVRTLAEDGNGISGPEVDSGECCVSSPYSMAIRRHHGRERFTCRSRLILL